MIELLDSLLTDVKKRVDVKDPTAVERAARIAEAYPDVPKVWRVLAYVHSMYGDMDGAVLAMNRMFAIAPPHPTMFLLRGDYELVRGNLHAALADFNQGIELSEQTQDRYCVEHLYFYRAEVLVRLGRKAEARADIAHVRNGFVEWMPDRRSKADILADCEE